MSDLNPRQFVGFNIEAASRDPKYVSPSRGDMYPLKQAQYGYTNPRGHYSHGVQPDTDEALRAVENSKNGLYASYSMKHGSMQDIAERYGRYTHPN